MMEREAVDAGYAKHGDKRGRGREEERVRSCTKSCAGSCAQLPSDSFPARRVMLATRLSSRMRGLLFAPESDDLLVLLPCHDIHTFGMRYAIDVAFIDRTGTVRKARRDVMPNKRLRHAESVAVIERRAIPREVWFEEGDRLSLGGFKRMTLPMGRHALKGHTDYEREGKTGGKHENMSDMQGSLLR